MATGNKRTVSFTIDADVLGSDGVNKLAKDVRDLAKDGGEAAPVFEELAQQIERVGQQNQAIVKVQQLQAETDQLATSAKEAATAELTLAEQMAALSAAAAEADARAVKARQTQDELTDTRKRQILALSEYRVSAEAAAAADDVYAAKVKELRQAINDTTGKLIAAQAERRSAVALAKEASAAETALATSIKRSTEETAKTNAALQARSQALAQAQQAAGQLGVDTQNLSAEQVRLATALKDAATAANAQAAAIDEAAAQEAEALQIQQAFAQAVKAADAALAEQVATLKSTEASIEAYNAAQTEAISLGERDVAANERRIAAAQQLIRSDELLSQAQRELANARNQARAGTLAEAQALVQVAEAAQRSLAATRQLTQEAASAGRVLNDAFAATGVRSLQAIEGEIARTEAALSTLERKFRAGAISAQDLERATAGATIRLAQLQAEAQQVPSGPGVFERINNQITGLANRFGALSAALATFALAFKPLIETEVELQRLNRVLTTITGSQQKTAETIEFLRSASQAAGQSFSETAGAYSKFAAAAVNSGIPLGQVNQIFQATANAAGNMGLSVDDTSRILTALGQIASKGVVSMEELRQQLGDALPGALQLTAKSLGLTSGELIKLIESGQLLAKDGLPAIAKGMTELASKSGEVSGLTAEWNRFKNVVSEAGTVITEGPFGAAAGAIALGLGKALETVIIAVAGVSEAFRVAAGTIYGVVRAITERDLGALKEEFDRAAVEGGKNLSSLEARFQGIGTAAQAATTPAESLAKAAAAAGTAAQSQATAFTASVDAINSATQASDNLAKAQTAAANAVGLAHSNAEAASQAWVRAQVDYTNAAQAAQVAATAADRLAQAKRTEGEASVALAEIAGNEIQIQQARATAATNTAAALNAQALADQNLANVYANELANLLKLVEAQGFADEAQVKQIEKLRQLVEAKQADAEKTEQQAAVADRLAQSLQLQTVMLGDNSKNLELYRNLLKQAADEQLRLHTAMEAGLATKEEVAKADGKVAELTRLVADALHDQTEAIERNAKAQESKFDIQQAQLNLQKAQLTAEIQLLEMEGNTYGALQKKIELKQLEIKIIEAKIAASLAEVKAQYAVIEAEKAELEALGQLTPAKQAEIDARLAALKVKELEAQASKAQIDILNKQVENLRIYGQESAKAYGASSAAIERETTAIGKNTTAWNANNAARMHGGQRVDENGFSVNSAGQTVVAQGVDSNYVINQLTSSGLSKEDAMIAARQAGIIDSNGQIHLNGYSSLAEAVKAATDRYKGQKSALIGTIDYSNIPTLGGSGGGGGLTSGFSPVGLGGSGSSNSGGRSPSPSPSPSPAPAPSDDQKTGTSSKRVIEIRWGRTKYEVGVSDDSSENAIVNFLEQLQEAASRSI